MTNYRKIGCVAGETPLAQQKLTEFTKKYGWINLANQPLADVDLLVVLGGDGFMLRAFHDYMERKVPFYGINCGTVGFLMNELSDKSMAEAINHAVPTQFQPLLMTAKTIAGDIHERLAYNEVSLLRETHQSAKLRVTVDNAVRMEELVCDGILVATPAGSTAYNMAVHGPIVPLNAKVLALTPISPFRPRNWRGALLPHNAEVVLDVQKPERRPVSAVADYFEVRDVVWVKTKEVPDKAVTVLFNADSSLEERVIKEQFMI